MPLADIDVKSAIDNLYQKYTGGAKDYATLRMELEDINKMILNIDANINNDSSNISYIAAQRKDKELAGIPKTIGKDRLYGIVLYKIDGYTRYVYVDVPTKTTPIIDPDIFYTNPDLDLRLYKQYLFESDGLDYLSTPVIGGVAVVKVPKNFPNHINSNPEDAVYLHMKRPDILITIDNSKQKARVPLTGFGGIMIVNSPGMVPSSAAPSVTGDLSPGTDNVVFAGEQAEFLSAAAVQNAINECKPEDPSGILDKLKSRYPKGQTKIETIFKECFTESPNFTKQILSWFNEASAMYGIDPDLSLSFSCAETSLGRQVRDSEKKASGWLQVMPNSQQINYPYYPQQLKLAQRWLLKYLGDKEIDGVKALQEVTYKKRKYFRMNEKLKYCGGSGAINLNKPKYWNIGIFHGIRNIWLWKQETDKRNLNGDVFAMAAGYNGGWGIKNGNAGINNLIRLGYRNNWQVMRHDDQNAFYMFKVWYFYKLIKCAKNYDKTRSSKAVPTV